MTNKTIIKRYATGEISLIECQELLPRWTKYSIKSAADNLKKTDSNLWTKEEDEIIMQYYNKNKTYDDLMKVMNVRDRTLYDISKRYQKLIADQTKRRILAKQQILNDGI